MENHGNMTIKDHNSGITCDLDYKAYSIFSSAEVWESNFRKRRGDLSCLENVPILCFIFFPLGSPNRQPRLVLGGVKDITGQTRLTLKATWDKYLAIATPGTMPRSSFAVPTEENENVTHQCVRRLSLPAGNEANLTTIWERKTPLPNFEKMYGFTRMAIEANEITPVDAGCAITDSRFRIGMSIALFFFFFPRTAFQFSEFV